MKRTPCISLVLVAGIVLPATVFAQSDVTNRLTLSARFGFNITARFKGFGGIGPAAPARVTPDGDAYNYDDGYVLTDVSGNFGGQTWYWGYDNSASQISGDTLLLSRSTLSGSGSSGSLDSAPYFGGELSFNRRIGGGDGWHYGVEGAANFMNLNVHDNRTVATRVTDAYPFAPGTTPPAATPSNPYQGSFGGPGFVIGDTPAASTTTTIGRRELDSNIWGLRLGPYCEIPLGRRVNVSASGGLAAGLLDSTVSWTQTVSGGGNTTTDASALDTVWGFFASANLSWRFSEHWAAQGGVQYQNLGKYDHSFRGQKVELDLRNSLFVTLGLSYCF